MRIIIGIVLLFATMLSAAISAAEVSDQPLSYSTWRITEGPVSLILEEQPFITQVNKPYELGWKLTNRTDTPLDCLMTFESIDTVTPLNAAGENESVVRSSVTIPAKGEIQGTFAYQVLLGTYNAHYPLHVRATFQQGGKEFQAHAVRVIEAKLPPSKEEFKTTKINLGGISLLDKSYIASYSIVDSPRIELGPCWTGVNKESRASMSPWMVNVEGENRMAYSLHPPYIPRGGSLFFEYPVELGHEKGYTLSYGCAVRRQPPTEPASDGVTFKVFARTIGSDEQHLLDEYHVTSFNWVDRTVSLDQYAGKKFYLTLEVNPGPKNITTCDSCCLSGLAISSLRGNEKATLPEAGRKFNFNLRNGMKAVIEPGPKGILDAKITLGNSKSRVTWNGIQLAIGHLFLDDSQTRFTKAPSVDWDQSAKQLAFRYEVLMNDESYPVTVLVREENGMIVFELPKENPAQIGRLLMKEVNTPPQRIYYGHGYIVEKPLRNVMISGGGHDLATSHVGFDFENGISILMASTVPPTFFNLSPEKNIYSLDVSGYTKFCLLPGDKGAIAAAIDYREHSGWKKSPSKGVARKAGRLVFDVWGGKAGALANTMETIFKYGVTDSLFLQHSWQRWGYDVRLPDIWAPDTPFVVAPNAGSLQDFERLAKICRENNVPFGLHDNYIDYYPDAAEFSYKYIDFNEQGAPVKAWINESVQARSYRWRPDLFMPFLDRNMKIANRYLPTMDAYFVDVFTSMNVFDFFTQEGKFVSKTVTQEYWGKAFEKIGEYLAQTDENGNKQVGITCSEAGDDFLIGWLDAADVQWLELTNVNRRFASWLPCERWARTPWFTAVNHTNFSRYGAGYSGRYEAQRSRDAHGIMSDDYISSEMLGGLDLMVDYQSLYPGSIVKHYLAQHVVRQLADQEMVSVEFANNEGKDDIFRQTLHWSNGTRVVVNKSEKDWSIGNGAIGDGTVGEFVLPMNGFAVFDKENKFLSGIIRHPESKEEVVEVSQRDNAFYLNGRGYRRTSLLPIEPQLGRFEDLGSGRFKVTVDWNCLGPAPKDLSIFVHIFSKEDEFKEKGWYAGGEWPDVPTSTWGTGEKTKIVQTGNNQVLQVPGNVPDGVYTILVGLYDSKGNGGRYSLKGQHAEGTRYGISNLEIKREEGKTNLTLTPFKGNVEYDHPQAVARLLANETPLTWRGVTTKGAVLVTPSNENWKILPIPVMNKFTITLNEDEIQREVIRITCDGKEIAMKKENGNVIFEVIAENAHIYEVWF